MSNNNNNNNNNKLYILEASKYFSALESPTESLKINSDECKDENNDSSDENYYFPLMKSNQSNSINEYSSLKFLQNNAKNQDQNSRNFTNNLNTFINDQDEFKSFEYTKTLLDSVRELEDDCIKLFLKQFKDKKIKNYSLDMSIEQILDEMDYESKLETLIREHICISSTNSLSSNNSSQNYLQLNSYPNSTEVSTLNEFKFKLNDDFILFEHCYDLLKYSNIVEVFNIFKSSINSLINKLITFLDHTEKETIKQVGNTIINWLNLDFESMTRCFKRLTTKEKWCLIKNLLYYSLKLTLFNNYYMSDKCNNNNELASSFCLILNSIYNFVKYFEIISA